MNNTTDITIVVDRSGSMQRTCDDASDGINRFVIEQKEADGVSVGTQPDPGEIRPSIERTAIHEAGHAVAEVVQGLSVDGVTILPDDDSYGKCSGPSVVGYTWHGKRERRRVARDTT